METIEVPSLKIYLTNAQFKEICWIVELNRDKPAADIVAMVISMYRAYRMKPNQKRKGVRTA